ncbi:MAG: hypothetical protein RQ833_04515 [Sphingomonadaceae bacterium]|nr:hypothetical protein [Sphingomonadaceae bacterium]
MVILRRRHDGWNASRIRLFFTELMRSRCVARAARAAGLTARSAYRLRARDADVAALWDKVLRLPGKRRVDL